MARKSGGLEKLGYWAVLVVVGVVLVGYYVEDYFNNPRIDAELCPTNPRVAIPSHAAVILDTTDPYSPNQKNRLGSWFRHLLEETPRYGRVSLYVMNADATEQPAAKVSLCSPPQLASDMWESLGTNLELMHQTWREEFQRQFIDELDAVDETSSQSPILERIPFVSNDAFAGANATVADKRLYLASDLLQHNERGYSMYKDPAREWAEFETRPDFATLTASPFMNGVSVEVLHLLRPCPPERELQAHEKHLVWWERYFIQLKVSHQSFEGVAGADDMLRCAE